MENTGFVFEEANLIGNRSKAVFSGLTGNREEAYAQKQTKQNSL
jgi:hypothetical protein